MKKFALILLTLTLLACGQGYETSNLSSDAPASSGGPACVAGTHLEAGVCISDVRTCTVLNGAGQETWNGTAFGACTVVTCNTGYRNQANACVFSPNSCPIANGSGQTQPNGQCQLVACNTGYTQSGGSCIANNPNPGGNPAWLPRNSARVFLSGHSLTDDPLAEYLGDIAQKRGDSYNYNEQIVIGSPIRVRTRGSSSTGWAGYSAGKNRNGSSGLNVISELRNPQTIGAGQLYDTLVLAENHNSLDMIQWESTVQYTRHYHDRAIEGNPAARTLFYNTWLDINKNAPAQWIDHEKKAMITWECAVSKVNLSLQDSGRSDRVTNLPTGAGLAHLVERALADQIPGISGSSVQKMNMIFSDNVHLTQLGVYYMALLTYSATYGKAPTGVTPPTGINLSTATELQRVAWDYINAYYNRPNPGQREMSECRTHVVQQFCSAYYLLKNMGGSIPGCQNFWGGTQSPFRWPDSSFAVLPAP